LAGVLLGERVRFGKATSVGFNWKGTAMRRWISILIVVLVLVLGGGLIASALARVQQAAARMQCHNNLRQIALSLANYHDSQGAYPQATIKGEARPYLPGLIPGPLPPEKRLSWLVDLVPYVEQLGIVIDRTKAWDDEENLEPRHRYRVDDSGTFAESPVGEWKVFHCPRNPSRAGPHSPGLTHFVGVAGVGAESADALAGDHGIGIFGHERRTRSEDVKDGTGTTMMVIETTWKNGPWTAGGHPTVRGLDPTGLPYLGADSQFGSNHPRSATNVAFADGSVRCLTDSVSPRLFEALATIAGGEEVALGTDW
jgi:prepilin-type processing-associated H-X9-DG protein